MGNSRQETVDRHGAARQDVVHEEVMKKNDRDRPRWRQITCGRPKSDFEFY